MANFFVRYEILHNLPDLFFVLPTRQSASLSITFQFFCDSFASRDFVAHMTSRLILIHMFSCSFRHFAKAELPTSDSVFLTPGVRKFIILRRYGNSELFQIFKDQYNTILLIVIEVKIRIPHLALSQVEGQTLGRPKNAYGEFCRLRA